MSPLLALAACAEPPAPPDVVLVSLDTVRADALSCYGNPRDTTPGLDRLAAEGVRFAEVLAPAPNTAPSHASLFTGLTPWAHRVANHSSVEKGTPALAAELETLAERFGGAGYETAAFTDDGPLGRAWNLLAGFDKRRVRYEDVAHKLRHVVTFLGEREEAPLFLFVHTYQAHQPYLPPPEWEARYAGDYAGPLLDTVAELRAEGRREAGNTRRVLTKERASFTFEDVAYLRALYDAEVAYTDRELETLWTALRDAGTWDDAVVCVTADHGEEFGEHGYFGHAQLHAETLHVPLVLKLAGGAHAGLVFPHRVSLVDVHATLLDAAGLAPADGVEDRSLLPFLPDVLDPERAVFAETTEHLLFGGGRAPNRRSVRWRDRALLSNVPIGGGEEQLELYDLAVDPGEASALDLEDAQHARRSDELRARIEEHLARALARRIELAGAAELSLEQGDPATEAQMRALGYMED